MNSAFLFDQFLRGSDTAEVQAQPVGERTLGDAVKTAGVLPMESGSNCRTWLDRFAGTPLFDQALQLEQQALALQAEEANQERALEDMKKQIGYQDWHARRVQREQLELGKNMLDLQLASLRNGGSVQPGVPPTAPPVPGAELAGAAAPPGASLGEAVKSAALNWSGLARAGGNIARSSVAPALIGGALGAVGNAATAKGDESTLGAALKGFAGGAAIGGGAHALARSSQALGLNKAVAGKYNELVGGAKAAPAGRVTQSMPSVRGPATVAQGPSNGALGMSPSGPPTAAPAALNKTAPQSVPQLPAAAASAPSSNPIPSLQPGAAAKAPSSQIPSLAPPTLNDSKILGTANTLVSAPTPSAANPGPARRAAMMGEVSAAAKTPVDPSNQAAILSLMQSKGQWSPGQPLPSLLSLG